MLFASLGRDYLWEDEGDTAVLARTILRYGVPTAWDGVTFSEPDYGQRLTSNFVMISHPWLQYYLAAASFALFGETPWAARFPFAIAGLITIVTVYVMMLRLLHDSRAALSSAVLLTSSAQFLLFSRQARNYSCHALLTCLLIWQFQRLNSWRNSALLALVGILLFHTHPIGLAAFGALALLTILDRRFSSTRRYFWPAFVVTVLYATPWMLASRAGYHQNTNSLDEVHRFLPRLLQFAVEYASVTPIIGIGLIYFGRRFLSKNPSGSHRAQRPGRSTRTKPVISMERRLITVCGVIVIAEAVTMAASHSRDAMWILGLHHTPELIPLTVMIAGILISQVSRTSQTRWVALLLIFGFTRVVQTAPWTFWAQPIAERQAASLVSFHVPTRSHDRIFRTGLFHLARSVSEREPNRGSDAHIMEFLRLHASSGDVVITNYGWEPLYFHTGLPQGAKISPSFPIYRSAQSRNLPDYVFGDSRVRWIVWRRAWPVYFPEQDCAAILERLTAAGFVPRLMRRVPETLYENRENIHFHRFEGDARIFPWYRNLPDVLIFRIETGKEAIARDREQLAQHPRDLDSLAHLGAAYLAMNDMEQALAAFRAAVDIDPKNQNNRRNLANALFDAGYPQEATVHARAAVDLKPDDAGAYDVLGRALAVQGFLQEAALQFERAIDIDANDPELRDHLERVRQAQKAHSPAPR